MKCHLLKNGIIEIVFELPNGNVLFFNGGGVKVLDKSEKRTKHWDDIKLSGTIVSILEKDGQFFFKLSNKEVIKVFFFPDDEYPNGVAQTIHILREDYITLEEPNIIEISALS